MKLLKECCDICAADVLDPTFLVDRSNWENLASETLGEDNFIFCYFLNQNHKYKKTVLDAAERLGYKIAGVSANGKDADWLELNNDITPEEFLERVKKAKLIFTDSFHGTALSMIMNRTSMFLKDLRAQTPSIRIREYIQFWKRPDFRTESSAQTETLNPSGI